MSIRDFKWSPSEKKIARAAFEKAYDNEITQIYAAVREQVRLIQDPHEVWKLHDYLSVRRKEVDEKYDYRYSVLPFVFFQLIRDSFISLEDLQGLSEEKIDAIKRMLGS